MITGPCLFTCKTLQLGLSPYVATVVIPISANPFYLKCVRTWMWSSSSRRGPDVWLTVVVGLGGAAGESSAVGSSCMFADSVSDGEGGYYRLYRLGVTGVLPQDKLKVPSDTHASKACTSRTLRRSFTHYRHHSHTASYISTFIVDSGQLFPYLHSLASRADTPIEAPDIKIDKLFASWDQSNVVPLKQYCFAAFVGLGSLFVSRIVWSVLTNRQTYAITCMESSKGCAGVVIG